MPGSGATRERHKAAPFCVTDAPRQTAYPANRRAAPTGRRSPFAARQCPGDTRRRRYSPGSPPGLDCWSTAAGATPAPGQVTGQHGAHTH